MEILQALAAAAAYFFAALIVGINTLVGILVATPPAPPVAPTAQVEQVAELPEAPDIAPAAPIPQPEAQPTPSTPAPSAPVTSLSPTPALPAAELNTQTRKALVNILCTTLAGGYVYPISGSGVIIDSRGVILTNAHVAQYFLLRDYGVKDNVDCVVRTGSPATPRYRAMLLYVGTAWISANASQLKSAQATGTGENDFAFLIITSATDGGSLPASFPSIPYALVQPVVGEQMLLAAYPAGFLSSELITKELYASSAYAYVTRLYTFDDSPNTDLYSIGGSVVSQAGSSGGATVRVDGTLGGIIATASAAGATTGERDLRAISMFHINRALAGQGKDGIVGLLAGNVVAKAQAFMTTVAPGLTKTLTDALDN